MVLDPVLSASARRFEDFVGGNERLSTDEAPQESIDSVDSIGGMDSRYQDLQGEYISSDAIAPTRRR